MGRLFVTELEGQVYTCKYCPDVHIAVYPPPHRSPPDFEYPPASFGKLYFFFKCVNVFIGAKNQTFDSSFNEVFCVACGSLLGLYYESAVGYLRYNEGNFYINRFKLHGPPEGSDNDENPEV